MAENSPVPGSASLRDVPWQWYDGLLAVGFLIPWRVLLLLPREWLAFVARLPQWQLWLLIYFIPVTWRFLLPLGLAWYRLGHVPISFPPWRCWLREFLIAVGILTLGILVVVVGVLCWMAFNGNSAPVSSVWSGASSEQLRRLDLLLLLSAMTIAPVTEEVFFRGLVYNWLRRYSPRTIALVLQGAVFALFHPFDIFHLGLVFVFGVVLGGLYEWRKTLLTPMLFHALKNVLASVAVALLGEA